MSVGTISQSEKATTEVLAAPVEEARALCRRASVAHLDETSWREGGKRAWLWVAVTSLVTVFVVRLSRGGQVARELLGERIRRYPGDGPLQCLQLVSGAVASAVLVAFAAGFRSDSRPWRGLRGDWRRPA